MGWTFFFLMVVLKIPIAALLYLVWYATREPDAGDESTGDDGGLRVAHDRHPRSPLPRHPRRGPHGDPRPAPRPRVRSVVARARSAR